MSWFLMTKDDQRRRILDTVLLYKAKSLSHNGSADIYIRRRYHQNCFGMYSSPKIVRYDLLRRLPRYASLLATNQGQQLLNWSRKHRHQTQINGKKLPGQLIHKSDIPDVDNRVRTGLILWEQFLPQCTSGHTGHFRWFQFQGKFH